MFFNGNPALGEPATVIDDKWLNDKQEEIVKTVEAAGFSPADTQPQLLEAIRYFILTRNEGQQWAGPGEMRAVQGLTAPQLIYASSPPTQWYLRASATGAAQSGVIPIIMPLNARISKVTVYGLTGAVDGTVTAVVYKAVLTAGNMDNAPVATVTLSAGETSDFAVPGDTVKATQSLGAQFLVYVSVQAATAVANALFYGVRFDIVYP
jgi:hypothetical protein